MRATHSASLGSINIQRAWASVPFILYKIVFDDA
jgi:hypothetical protein